MMGWMQIFFWLFVTWVAALGLWVVWREMCGRWHK